MKILLIDDHSLFRNGLRFLLSDLATDVDFLEAQSTLQLAHLPPEVDLVLLDYKLPGEDGLDAIGRVRQRFPEPQIVMVSGEETQEIVRNCIQAGASGFIPKSSDPVILVSALRLVLAGGVYLPLVSIISRDTPVAINPAEEKVDDEKTPVVDLHPRQINALLEAIRGRSNKMIARSLGLSEGTVKQYLSTAYRVLGVSNRTEAAFAAAALGIVQR